MQATFDDLGTPLHDVTFVVFDLETTGGSPTDDAITEIGAVKYRGGEVIGEFATLVNPGREIPPFITVLTGITHAMVVEAPRIEQVLPAFLEFVGDAVLVAHNARFDLGFTRAACDRFGYPRPANHVVDTASLARRLVRSEVRNCKLATLAAHFRAPHQPTHRALDDARATGHVLHAMLERVGTMGVTGLDDLLALPTAKGAPTFHKLRLTERLPRSPGVYLFRDRQGNVIYVGKATNLRARVRSYFYGDTRRTITTMLDELHAVDHIPCATELEASVLEVRLIHTHVPRHNRRSKPPRSHHWLTLSAEAFPRLVIARTHRPDDPGALGPFRSRRAAEIVQHAIWDAVPIRRCSGKPGSAKGPCRFAQLGVALCPCDGSLDEGTYRDAIAPILRAMDTPEALLDPLAARMRALAATNRFEEAAWLRDRHEALRRCLEWRQAWELLGRAGRVTARRGDVTVVIDGGRLTTTWIGTHTPPLPLPGGVHPTTPPDALVAEELSLLWKFLTDPATRIEASDVAPEDFRRVGIRWAAVAAALRAS